MLGVVEVWGTAGAINPGVGFVHGVLHWAEVHAILFCAGDEEDAFQGDVVVREGFEEVLEQGSCEINQKGIFL